MILYLSSHVLQASVCSDAGASYLRIHTLRQEIGEEYEGSVRPGSADESLLLQSSDLFLRTQGYGVISSLACMSCPSLSRS